MSKQPVRLGIGGPVGTGKTALVRRLTELMNDDYAIGVITNDIYTREDADQLIRESVLNEDQIIGVETGGCPHTAIREDASMNFDAIDDMIAAHNEELDLVIVESGGDNLSATFSPELVEAYIFVIDVAEGPDIPRKGGPALSRSDLLVVNKIDLAPYVDVDLEEYEEDVKKTRNGRPYVMAGMRNKENLDRIVDWIKKDLFLED